jgi:hypothetical protein
LIEGLYLKNQDCSKKEESDQIIHCQHYSCDKNQNEDLIKTVQEMKTTIEVLDMENLYLKNELSEKFDEWKEPKKPCKLHKVDDSTFQLKINNRYDILSKNDDMFSFVPKNSNDREKSKATNLKAKRKSSYMDNNYTNNDNTNGSIQFRNSTKQLPEIHLFADSHGRGLSEFLKEKLPSSTVNSMFKPNARFLDVIPEKKYLKQDQYIFIMAGTNDVSMGESDSLIKAIPSTLDYLSKYKIILSTLPIRHDLDLNHPVNEEIMYVNAYLKDVIKTKPNVKLLDISYIDRKYFTQFGLHFNNKGKQLVSHLLTQTLLTLHNTTKKLQERPDNFKNTSQTSMPHTLRQDKSYKEAARNMDITTHPFIPTVIHPFLGAALHQNTQLC